MITSPTTTHQPPYSALITPHRRFDSYPLGFRCIKVGCKPPAAHVALFSSSVGSVCTITRYVNSTSERESNRSPHRSRSLIVSFAQISLFRQRLIRLPEYAKTPHRSWIVSIPNFFLSYDASDACSLRVRMMVP